MTIAGKNSNIQEPKMFDKIKIEKVKDEVKDKISKVVKEFEEKNKLIDKIETNFSKNKKHISEPITKLFPEEPVKKTCENPNPAFQEEPKSVSKEPIVKKSFKKPNTMKLPEEPVKKSSEKPNLPAELIEPIRNSKGFERNIKLLNFQDKINNMSQEDLKAVRDYLLKEINKTKNNNNNDLLLSADDYLLLVKLLNKVEMKIHTIDKHIMLE
ncbi:MAG: hypothetical protein KatS3mg068_1931 [Candidatus Sericytochromatia bacterium]|nr:MAG: hypothetical protein KatS3mg068_1931 [Candidatus Sericytochromatia bacterium]